MPEAAFRFRSPTLIQPFRTFNARPVGVTAVPLTIQKPADPNVDRQTDSSVRRLESMAFSEPPADRPHRIRLAGPWQIDWVGPEEVPSTTLATASGSFPANWRTLFGEVYGTARFSRRFGRPTGLDEGTRVWLSIPNYSGMLSVELNERVLAILPEDELPVRFDITDSLRSSNRLILEVTAGPEIPTGAGRREPVQLEIVEAVA